MKEINERPVCHRAEDLVTYLYNEANEAEARDFANHAESCDACRAELSVFQQVHESILLWRNDALGSAFSAATLPLPATTETRVNSMQPAQRRLSALAALREFFSVSPLWLRGATAFATVMLCVLAVLAISRSWNRAPQLANSSPEQKVYTESQFKETVAKQVKEQLAELSRPQNSTPPTPEVADNAGQRTTSGQRSNRIEVAGNSITSKQQRARGLTRAEREQLAADLRLTSRDDEELPFGLTEEPNQ
jgi:hypothetical protein